MIIERVALPGIGVSHTATTGRRQRVGVISHLSGRRDLVVYDPDDPERAAYAVVLDATEADHLAGLLAAAITVEAPPSTAAALRGSVIQAGLVEAGIMRPGRAKGDPGDPAVAPTG